MAKGLIFVVSGPSGSGKSTLLKQLLRSVHLKNRLVKSVSYTTRPRRPGEVNGRDYFFISQKQFREELKAKKILEWTKYLGYYYATPEDFLKRQIQRGKSAILCLDLKGALQVRRLYPKNTVTIFVVPPSIDVLCKRLQNRCRKTKKTEIQKRLFIGRKELLAAARYDYRIVNSKLAQAVKQLKDIILKEMQSA